MVCKACSSHMFPLQFMVYLLTICFSVNGRYFPVISRCFPVVCKVCSSHMIPLQFMVYLLKIYVLSVQF